MSTPATLLCRCWGQSFGAIDCCCVFQSPHRCQFCLESANEILGGSGSNLTSSITHHHPTIITTTTTTTRVNRLTFTAIPITARFLSFLLSPLNSHGFGIAQCWIGPPSRAGLVLICESDRYQRKLGLSRWLFGLQCQRCIGFLVNDDDDDDDDARCRLPRRIASET